MLQTKLAKLAQNTVLRLHIKLTWFIPNENQRAN